MVLKSRKGKGRNRIKGDSSENKCIDIFNAMNGNSNLNV